jgi:hypothetical protein
MFKKMTWRERCVAEPQLWIKPKGKITMAVMSILPLLQKEGQQKPFLLLIKTRKGL